MAETKGIRILGTLLGDICREPSARTKYGLFFEAVRQRFQLIDVIDAQLKGFDRILNAFITFHPNQHLWREKFYKNVPAFRIRSQRVSSTIMKNQDHIDLILQVGVLFDSNWDYPKVPSVIYTDYTANMAAQKPAAGRSPFNPQQLTEWIELERQSFARAAHICTRSHLVRDSIVKDYGLPHHRVTVIGGGVNFMPLPEPIIHDQIDRPTALFIGKELYRKGGDILLRAFAKARAEVPNAQLLFLTEDRVPNGLPLDGVELVRPTWDRKVIADLYLRSHVLVLPSRLETWGDVLLEAMSYGLPCIGVSGQAMEEVIDHCGTGLIIPPEDEMELASALVRLFRDTDLRKAWGLAARRRTESEYTWERVVERASPAIESAISATEEVGDLNSL